MRSCPHCGNEIQDEAVFCRFCKREVDPPIWLTSLSRCPFCAEWVEQGVETCPLCGNAITAVTPDQTPPFTSPKPDDLITNLREQSLEDVEPPQETIDEAAQEPRKFKLPFQLPRRREEPKVSPPPTDANLESYRSSPVGESRGVRSFDEIVAERPAPPRAPRPSIFESDLVRRIGRILVLILVIGGVVAGLVALAVGPGKPYIAQLLAPQATATEIPPPSETATLDTAATLAFESAGTTQSEATATVAATPTTEAVCVEWDQVSLADAGKELCVFGVVRRWFSVEDIPFVAIFSEDPGTFAFIDHTTDYPQVRPGTCITATGPIEVMRGVRPYIDVEEILAFCEQEPEGTTP